MDRFYAPTDLLIFRLMRMRVEGPPSPRKLIFEIEVSNRTSDNLVVLGSSITVSLNNVTVAEGDFFHSHHALARGFVVEASEDGFGTIDIPLSLESITHIEERRRGDVEYRIQGTVVVAPLSPGPPETIGRPREAPVSRRLGDPIKNTISQSEWVQFLAQVGYQETLLFEFPVGNQRLYPGVFQRWEQALDQYRNHKWEDTLFACKKVFEAFAATKTPDTRDKPDSRTLRQFFEENEEGDILNRILSEFSDFLQLGRHEQLSSKGIRISREDAQLALTITGAYLRFMSR